MGGRRARVGAPGRVGALLLGYYDAGRRVCATRAKVGTGFTEAELDRLDALLAPLERDDEPVHRHRRAA